MHSSDSLCSSNKAKRTSFSLLSIISAKTRLWQVLRRKHRFFIHLTQVSSFLERKPQFHRLRWNRSCLPLIQNFESLDESLIREHRKIDSFLRLSGDIMFVLKILKSCSVFYVMSSLFSM